VTAALAKRLDSNGFGIDTYCIRQFINVMVIVMPTVQELRERAKREQERKRRQQNSSGSTPFSTDGFFESTQYYNTPDNSDNSDNSGCGYDSGSSSSDSGSCSFDS